MNTTVLAWAERHGITPAALRELHSIFRMEYVGIATAGEGRSEAYVQSALRLRAAQAGYLVFRNNVGATQDETGRVIRFGLCNDSAQMNKEIKSADLIGLKPNGQFWSRECKHEGWKYTGTPRERAQLRWIEIVTAAGGDAAFACRDSDI